MLSLTTGTTQKHTTYFQDAQLGTQFFGQAGFDKGIIKLRAVS